MSIKGVAKELYRLQKELEKLEDQLRSAPPEQRIELELKFKKTKAERDRVKALLEGMKQYPDIKRPK